MTTLANASLFPATTQVSSRNHLVIGGCDTLDLASEFGTPLYIFDETDLRARCQEFKEEFSGRYPNTEVCYAAKAFINPALAQFIHEEGLGLDVVSGGELAVAMAVGFPPERVYFHGNNKSEQELEMALDLGVGRIAVDNFLEMETLDRLARGSGTVQKILVRLSPGVDPHTHVYTTTGVLDTKFGFSMETGAAEQAVLKALEAPNLDLMGLHFHLGSPIFELEPYAIAIDTVVSFAAELTQKGLRFQEFSPGGGFAIGYLRDRLPPPISAYAETITEALKSSCSRNGVEPPQLIIEPGRAIVGPAGVALYSVGATKDIPGVRKYVSLDGGMADNIRPALYEARYEAVVANRTNDAPSEKVTLAGKFCESGDILIRDIMLPALEPGDLIAIPSSGAYSPSMASNYNLASRPAMVMVKEGQARLIRRRETFQDLMRCDVY